MKLKRAITSILVAWLLFIGVDFLFHAALLSNLWEEDIPAIKPLQNLAMLIPVGYLSFLLLVALIGYLFFRIFKTKPSQKEVLKFAVVFGGLFALSNGLGLYSYVSIPLKQLILFNLVYLIEIIVATLAVYFVAYSTRVKKIVWRIILIFVSLIVLSIIIQNILANN